MAENYKTDEELEELFKKIDKNKSGTITKDELEKFLQKLGKSKADSKKAAKSMMIHDDTDRNGEITLEEFISACRNR